MASLNRLLRNVAGATAIEYALLASLIAVAAIASMRSVGSGLIGMYSNVSNAL